VLGDEREWYELLAARFAACLNFAVLSVSGYSLLGNGKHFEHRDLRVKEMRMLGRLFAIAYHYRAYRSHGRGEYQRSLFLYTKSLEYKPDSVPALCNRSLVYQQLGEHSCAVVDLDRVIELRPKFGLAYFNRGISAKILGDLNRAIADQTRAIELSPNDANAHGELGVLHMLRLEYDLAIVSLTRATKLAPSDPNHLLNRGITQFFRANFSIAADDLRRSLNLVQDTHATLIYFLAQARMGLNGTAQLENDARAIDLNQWPGPLISLFLGLQSPQAIISHRIDAKQKAEAHFYIGQWYLLKNSQIEAITALKEAKQHCPISFFERAGAIAELERLGCL
jgi:tetratricopeptide (TPR) repeat protein